MFSFFGREESLLIYHAKIIFAVKIIFTIRPAMAHLEHEQDFDLCIAQPLLQSDRLTSILEEKISGGHDPLFDEKSIKQLVNTTQYNAGNECAETLVAHPDVYWAIIREDQISKKNLDNSWVAKNSWCQNDFTVKCTVKETEDFAEIILENKQFKGVTPWSQSCMVVLSFESTTSENKNFIDIVHRQNPDRDIAVKCAFEVGWHSMNEGTRDGSLIAKYLANNKK